jgi:hypothetical protein
MGARRKVEGERWDRSVYRYTRNARERKRERGDSTGVNKARR